MLASWQSVLEDLYIWSQRHVQIVVCGLKGTPRNSELLVFPYMESI